MTQAPKNPKDANELNGPKNTTTPNGPEEPTETKEHTNGPTDPTHKTNKTRNHELIENLLFRNASNNCTSSRSHAQLLKKSLCQNMKSLIWATPNKCLIKTKCLNTTPRF